MSRRNSRVQVIAMGGLDTTAEIFAEYFAGEKTLPFKPKRLEVRGHPDKVRKLKDLARAKIINKRSEKKIEIRISSVIGGIESPKTRKDLRKMLKNKEILDGLVQQIINEGLTDAQLEERLLELLAEQ